MAAFLCESQPFYELQLVMAWFEFLRPAATTGLDHRLPIGPIWHSDIVVIHLLGIHFMLRIGPKLFHGRCLASRADEAPGRTIPSRAVSRYLSTRARKLNLKSRHLGW